MTAPSSITVSRSRRGTTVKARGRAAQALFDLMAAQEVVQAQDTVGAPPPWPCTVHFEDHGQDFLEWDIDADGVVVGCRPMQGWVWRGKVLATHPEPGQKLSFVSDAGKRVTTVSYPVAKVVRHLVAVPAGENGHA